MVIAYFLDRSGLSQLVAPRNEDAPLDEENRRASTAAPIVDTTVEVDVMGCTALHVAAKHGNVVILELLKDGYQILEDREKRGDVEAF